ncbi:peptidase C14 caspase catalytic subunit p20 [Candidatus Moduliflexus flocculans]|uniref:Peptidase C14 caspase catalytic subunit p20 n=1 Tax=Candidatus Moduliflexus flocculans TaxID=1499966 RepID=A0A0S6VWY9_9BACT|nr:peptidase C14 caspase catalytic subunit p20 [Candidatus Moduliflexus flocculans]
MKRIGGLCIIVLLLGATTTQAAPKTWGLCIGISEYNVPELSLKWADKDAIEFSTFLRYGLGLPEDQYRILKNSDATRENIRDAFGWLGLVAKPEDRVYIFYSGHGKDNSPLVPYDIENAFTLESLQKALSKIEANEIIFFADACFSGKIAGKGAKPIIDREHLTGLNNETVAEITKSKPGVVVMTSANGIQEAYEKDGQKNGLFTYYLMNTLMDPNIHAAIDLDRNGKVSLFEVYQNVRYLVASESKQEPQISDGNAAQQVMMFAGIQTIPKPTTEPVSTTSSGEKKGMSTGTKVALGVGVAAAIGGGVALTLNSQSSDNGADTPADPSKVKARLQIVPDIQTSCGSIAYRLYVDNASGSPVTVSRIDYEETLTQDEPPSTCKQGRRGSFLPDIRTVPAYQWALVREWQAEFYSCGGCPYKFSECAYALKYTVATSAGTIAADAVEAVMMNSGNYCQTAPTPTPTPDLTPTPGK